MMFTTDEKVQRAAKAIQAERASWKVGDICSDEKLARAAIEATLDADETITEYLSAQVERLEGSLRLVEHLCERHKLLMRQTEREAEAAAGVGDLKRQSLASTESERHRAVYSALRLILDDPNTRVALDRS